MTTAPLDPDPRLVKINEITIAWPTFKKTLTRNYLDPNYEYQRQDRSFVLRLHPPFESEMEAKYFESEQGRHYNDEWSEKPFHMKPELFIMEGTEKGFLWLPEYPTERNTREALTEEEIKEDGGIENAVEIGREIYWNEVKGVLPKAIDLSIFTVGPNELDVDINWTDIEN